MKLLRTKPPKEAPVAAPSLADRIKAARAEATAFIDAETQKIKNSPDGASLPFGVLRQMITRHSRCACAVALNLLEPKP
jgi:hypothetical protein